MKINYNIIDLTKNVFCLKRKVNESTGKQFKLAAIEVDILTFVYMFKKDVSATHIIKDSNFKKNTISIHVDNLVKLGYLKRKEKLDDRRTIYLIPTAKAIEVAEHNIKKMHALNKQLLRGLTPDQVKIMQNNFKIINKNACDLLNNRSDYV